MTPGRFEPRRAKRTLRRALLSAIAALQVAGCLVDEETEPPSCSQGQPCSDVTPPSAPTGLVARLVEPLSIELSWNASTDDVGVTGYAVWRSGDFSPELVTDTGFVWHATLPRTQYCFFVTASDEWNVSPPSETVCVITGSPPPHVDDPDLGITCSIAFDDAGGRHLSAAWGGGRLVDADWEVGGASGISTVGGSTPRIHVCYVAGTVLGDAIHYETFGPSGYAWEPIAGVGETLLLATRCSIGTDVEERPFVAFDSLTCSAFGASCRRNLTFARRSGGTWYAYPVDWGDLRYPSVAVSPSGAPWVVYYDAENGVLKRAFLSGETFTPEVVDDAGDVGAYAALAIDDVERLHVSYYDATAGDLKYATGDRTSWSVQTVDADGNVGTYTSLALDATGKAHVAYFDETHGTLKYATNASGSWTQVTVGESATLGSATSIAVDPDGKVHILWIDYTYPETSHALRSATNATGAWETTKLRSL